MKRHSMLACLAFASLLFVLIGQVTAEDNVPPPGFNSLFNVKDLTGWQGLVEINKREKDPAKYAEQVKGANEKFLPHWTVRDGALRYDGHGQSLQTAKDYRNFELWVDWKIGPKGDSGIYLRGNPQVQIWDPTAAPQNKVGSGGLFNNKKNLKDPLQVADKPVGEWNTNRIVMRGDRVSVWLNGELVVDETPLENYWEAGKPLPATGPIELQHHGDELWFKNIFIKELPDDDVDAWASLFNGSDFAGWKKFLDPKASDADPDRTWTVKDGMIVCSGDPYGYLVSEKEFGNYVLHVEWRWGEKIVKGRNSGVFVHVVGEDKIWPKAVEAQLFADHAGDFWLVDGFKLKVDESRQDPKNARHFVRTKDHVEKTPGEWNQYTITCKGDKIQLVVNGQVVNEGTQAELSKGKILLQSEGAEIHFRNIEVKPVK